MLMTFYYLCTNHQRKCLMDLLLPLYFIMMNHFLLIWEMWHPTGTFTRFNKHGSSASDLIRYDECILNTNLASIKSQYERQVLPRCLGAASCSTCVMGGGGAWGEGGLSAELQGGGGGVVSQIWAAVLGRQTHPLAACRPRLRAHRLIPRLKFTFAPSRLNSHFSSSHNTSLSRDTEMMGCSLAPHAKYVHSFTH